MSHRTDHAANLAASRASHPAEVLKDKLNNDRSVAAEWQKVKPSEGMPKHMPDSLPEDAGIKRPVPRELTNAQPNFESRSPAMVAMAALVGRVLRTSPRFMQADESGTISSAPPMGAADLLGAANILEAFQSQHGEEFPHLHAAVSNAVRALQQKQRSGLH